MAVQIGDGVGRLGRCDRAQLVGDRSGETVIWSAAAAPAASTAASAAARTAIAIAGLIVADCALRFVGFVLIAFGIGGGNRLDRKSVV